MEWTERQRQKNTNQPKKQQKNNQSNRSRDQAPIDVNSIKVCIQANKKKHEKIHRKN